MRELFSKAEHNLKQFWGYDAFRPGQDEAVKSVFEGQDTLVLFPTGGGKSLCYQVPATVLDGLTLVISPLVALMQDQVQQLKNRDISAEFINSTISQREVEQRLINARNGMYKLLYCAPERLNTVLFQKELLNLNIRLVAVDEAHCISEWGHEFRPAYREIKPALEALPETTAWLALTATATPEVRQDILDNLGFAEPKVISQGFSRPNLTWWMVHTAKKRERLIRAVKKASKTGDGLIYGGTRKNCEGWAAYFTQNGIKAEAYHAGLEAPLRKQIQERWINGSTPLVVATNAFGMGIDKPDCRYVIHEEMPASIEAYYQEAGRAGRDGLESYPVLFYRVSDYVKARKRLEQHYPTRKQFEKVYQALCDSFELAEGSVMQEAEDLDLENVALRAGEPPVICRAALRLLEQFGVLASEEKEKNAVWIQFTRTRDLLARFKEESPNAEKAEFVDRLERLFGSEAFVDGAEIEEEELLGKLRISHNSLLKALNVLMADDGLLRYKILSGRILVKVLGARSAKLPLGKEEAERHRNRLLEKLERMNQFVNSPTCREVYLKNYFGETGAKPCGHCDNCLQKTGDKTDFISSEIYKKAVELFAHESQTAAMLQKNLGCTRSVVQLLLRHLIGEGKITVSAENPGHYYWTK